MVQVTGPRARRNSGPVEPDWCCRTDHSTVARGPMHRSKDVAVGARLPFGLVSARLLQPIGGTVRVAVTACQSVSATSELSLDEVDDLRAKLGELLRQAGRPAAR